MTPSKMQSAMYYKSAIFIKCSKLGQSAIDMTERNICDVS